MDVCCQKHPDVLLRQLSVIVGWKVVRSECPRCAEAWRAAREPTETSVNASEALIVQEDAQRSSAYEREMIKAVGDKDAQIAVLHGRVDELQRENAALLSEVERLRQEIDLATASHAKEGQALQTAKEKLLKEREAVVDGHFSSLQSSYGEMMSVMQKMARDVKLLRTQSHPSPSPPQLPPAPCESVVSVSVEASRGAALPADIQLCHAELTNSREQLLRGVSDLRLAESRVKEEEAALRSSLSAALPATAVDEKLRLIRSEIDRTGTVWEPAGVPLMDALQLVKTTAVTQAQQKQRVRDLQKQLMTLHRSHDFVFAAADDTFSRWQLGHLRQFGFTARDMRDCGFTATYVRGEEVSAKDARDAGFSVDELRSAGYTLLEMRRAGVSVREARDAGFTLAEMREVGYSAKEARSTGYSTSEMGSAGYVAFSDELLRQAVQLWCSDRSEALRRYGHISTWDVSNVRSMKELFKDQRRFNDDISQWNVGQVTYMGGMFEGASSFNQPLSDWNVSQVTNMYRMFKEPRRSTSRCLSGM